MSSSKMSSQTRKILTQNQKKGNSYVPIQHRAEELLKERGLKMAKLKKEREIAQMIEEKECTFKPKLTKSYKSQKKKVNNASKIE